jgi:hypothetical protein
MKLTFLTIIFFVASSTHAQIYGGIGLGFGLGKPCVVEHEYVAKSDGIPIDTFTVQYPVSRNDLFINVFLGYRFTVFKGKVKLLPELEAILPVNQNNNYRNYFVGARMGPQITLSEKSFLNPFIGVVYSQVNNTYKFLNTVSKSFGVRYKRGKVAAQVAIRKNCFQIQVELMPLKI